MSKAIKFLQAAHIAGKDYAHNSVHPLSDELIAQPYFKKLVNSGLVVEAEAVQVITPVSLAERQKALADYISKKSVDKKAKADSSSESGEGGEKAPEGAGGEGQGEKAPEGSEGGEQSPSDESHDDQSGEGDEHEHDGESDESGEGEESETEHKGHAKKKSKKHKR